MNSTVLYVNPDDDRSTEGLVARSATEWMVNAHPVETTTAGLAMRALGRNDDALAQALLQLNNHENNDLS